MREVYGWAFPDADRQMAREMAPDGSYQAAHLAAALAHVTDWRCALDGGAHVGTWARVMAGRFAEVLAVEPSPDTFEALEANMVAFGCANVRTIRAALGAELGRCAMLLDSMHEKAGNTGARYTVSGHGTIPQVTVDSLALPALGLLKLDIEGAEPLALAGARLTLARCRPIVIYENKGLCRRHGLKADAPAQELKAAGYRRLGTVVCDEIWGPA
jgi:FkbM family methyltransferase